MKIANEMKIAKMKCRPAFW